MAKYIQTAPGQLVNYEFASPTVKALADKGTYTIIDKPDAASGSTPTTTTPNYATPVAPTGAYSLKYDSSNSINFDPNAVSNLKKALASGQLDPTAAANTLLELSRNTQFNQNPAQIDYVKANSLDMVKNYLTQGLGNNVTYNGRQGYYDTSSNFIATTPGSYQSLSSSAAPTNVSGVANAPSVNMPTASPTIGSTNTVGGMVSYYDSLAKTAEQRAADAKAERERVAAQQEDQTQGFLSKLMGSQSPEEARNNAYAQTGIDPTQYFAEEKAQIAEIGALSEEYNNLVAAKDAQIAASSDRLGSMNFINNQIAQIERNAAPQLNRLSANIKSKAAVLEASQGRFEEAQKYVNQAVSDATAELKYNADMYTLFYEQNQDVIDRLDAKYKDAMKDAQEAATNAFNLAYKEKTDVGNLMISNPGAGITIEDTLESALAKAGNNPMPEKGTIFGSNESGYYQQVYDKNSNSYVIKPVTGGTNSPSNTNIPSGGFDFNTREGIDALPVSSLTKAIISGYGEVKSLTPTDKAKVISELRQVGYDPNQYVFDQLRKLADIHDQIPDAYKGAISGFIPSTYISLADKDNLPIVNEFNSARILLTRSIARLKDVGVLSDQDVESYDKAMPSRRDPNRDAVDAKLRGIEAGISTVRATGSEGSSTSTAGRLTSPDGKSFVNISDLTSAQIKEAKDKGWK